MEKKLTYGRNSETVIFTIVKGIDLFAVDCHYHDFYHHFYSDCHNHMQRTEKTEANTEQSHKPAAHSIVHNAVKRLLKT